MEKQQSNAAMTSSFVTFSTHGMDRLSSALRIAASAMRNIAREMHKFPLQSKEYGMTFMESKVLYHYGRGIYPRKP